MSNPYIYLFVREDLSRPQQIVQTAHAVDELNKEMSYGEITSTTNFMVLCAAEDEWELYDISEYLNSHNIEHHLFFEPDIDGHTAIATKPLVGEQRIPMQRFSTMK